MNRFLYLPLLFPYVFRPSYKFNNEEREEITLSSRNFASHLPTIEDTSYRHCKMLFQHLMFPFPSIVFTRIASFFVHLLFSWIYLFFFHTHYPHFLTPILYYFIKNFYERKKNTSPFSYAARFNHLSKLILTTHASIFPFLVKNRISRNPSIYKL